MLITSVNLHAPGRLDCLQQVLQSHQKLTCNHVADHEGVWILRPCLHMALRLLVWREHLHRQLPLTTKTQKRPCWGFLSEAPRQKLRDL